MKPLKNWIPTEQGILVPTSEHAYQANKFLDPVAHSTVANARFFDAPNKPIYADGYVCKEIAKSLIENGVPTRPDLKVARFGLMKAVTRLKYDMNLDLAERLVATDNQLLVEGNTWADRYWGVDPIGGINGFNNLGILLMLERRRQSKRLSVINLSVA